MRIVAGAYKGLQVRRPQGVRATSEKMREALFDVLGEAVSGAAVLDLFAGSGALGLEAVSRGAVSVTWVEREPGALKMLRDNVGRLQQQRGAVPLTILSQDVGKALRSLGLEQRQFDLILLDPPYSSTWAKKSLSLITQYVIVAAGGLVAVEHHRQLALPDDAGPLRRIFNRRYGGSVLSIYQAAQGDSQ